jgi:Ca-activated chloride channel family protein
MKSLFFKEIKKSLGKARVFTFGIGPAVNRLLLDSMAEMGRGTSRYITFEENIEDAIQKFSNQTSFPVLTDISLEWKDSICGRYVSCKNP